MIAETNQLLESQERAACLLSQAGFGDSFALVPVQGGANSKAFRVDLADGTQLFFKEYFRHPHDLRDRLGTEYAFASFAYNQGLRTIAQPYAADREHGCALYSFIEGSKLTPSLITADLVRQCLDFLDSINEHKGTQQAADLPIASEACFSLEDHWECLRRRVRRLDTIQPENEIDEAARVFASERLAPAAKDYLRWATDSASQLGIDCNLPIERSDRCLSPSDFGFHNALLTADGSLHFLDFEYAGWDDPAKTVCDFFCQPACPVAIEFWDMFMTGVAKAMSDPALFQERCKLLFPMYRLKWCCIMLNDFMPAGAGRRRFAISHLDDLKRKQQQLQKAQQALRQLS